MEAPAQRIETERLVLRRPVPADAAVIAREYAHDPDVSRYVLFRPDQTDEAIAGFIGKCIDEWDTEKAFAWVIERRDTGELVGMIDARPDTYMVNVGYVLAKNHWNRGYATEALRAVVAWADAQPDISRTWAICSVENAPSARVLEKAGFEQESYLPKYMQFPNLEAGPHDCYCYSRVKQ
jgi:[ribosomal protein S5]-alanine N-acetyltransferase